MCRKAIRHITMSNNDSLHAVRDVVSHVFRLTMATMKKDYEAAPILFDEFLNSTVHMLEAKEEAKASAVELSKQAGETITTAFLARDSVRDLFEPTPYSPSRKSPPKLVIYPEEQQTVIVEKVAPPPSESKVVTVDVPEETEPANRIVTASESTSPEPEEIEADDIEPDIEPEDDDEEEMTKIKVGRKTYFLGSKTNFVYEFMDEENAGQLLGKYENKKIMPL